jgi:hypothetical protein
MDDIAKRLGEALGADCDVMPADVAVASLRQSVSMLAYATFDFGLVELLGEGILLARPREDLAPARLVRLLDEVDAASPHPVVCSLRSVTPYLRDALLRERRGFVTDDGQAYVPGFLRLVPKRRLKPVLAPESWGPAERQAFIYLLGCIGEDATVADLREVTGMSTTSATRAIARVAAIAPIEKSVGGSTGRTNMWRVEDAESFVERGTVAFGDPVRRRLFVEAKEAKSLPLVGLSALADRSLLVPPSIEQRACGVARAKELHARDPYESEALVREVIVLSYDPTPFAEGGLVDLYTMVRTVDRANERVDSAVEEATEDCPWLRLV